MTTITPAVLEQNMLSAEATNTQAKELGQTDFMELMMAQLKNQDPMKPMDNGEFLGQMAQFSTVSGIEDMQVSMGALAETYASGQTLQSAQLVGQEVLVQNSTFELNEGEPVAGSFELEAASGDVKLDITDAAGNVVQQVNLGAFTSGRHVFNWDGLNSEGKALPPGKYSANVTFREGEGYEAATVLTSRVVDSVEFGAAGETTLNTQQGDSLTMADIRQIRSTTPIPTTQQ